MMEAPAEDHRALDVFPVDAGGEGANNGGQDIQEHKGQATTDSSTQTDKDDLGDMRGSLITVATLFVTLAFEAVLNPPKWVRPEWYTFKAFVKRPAGAGAEYYRAAIYLGSVMAVFAIALTMVLLLLSSDTAKRTMDLMAKWMLMVAAFVAVAFALCASSDWGMTVIVCLSMMLYAVIAVFYLRIAPTWLWRRMKMARGRRPRKMDK